jgi:hypothetical protein
VPLTALLNTIGVMAPEQILCDDGVAVATGTGFTSTFALLAQLFVVGVMVNVTYKGAAVVFVNAPLILPEPLFAIPVTVAVLFLVQLYVVPPPAPFDEMLDMLDAEQIVCSAGVVVTGVDDELTITAGVMAVPVQAFAVGVMVNVVVTDEPLLFVNAPVILPVPLEAIPVSEEVLSLVQL